MNIQLGKCSHFSEGFELHLHNKLHIPHVNSETSLNLWDPALGLNKEVNFKLIQTFQNKGLRDIVSVVWYTSNYTIHYDLTVCSHRRNQEIHRENRDFFNTRTSKGCVFSKTVIFCTEKTKSHRNLHEKSVFSF